MKKNILIEPFTFMVSLLDFSHEDCESTKLSLLDLIKDTAKGDVPDQDQQDLWKSLGVSFTKHGSYATKKQLKKEKSK
jgi:hypothetical protein